MLFIACINVLAVATFPKTSVMPIERYIFKYVTTVTTVEIFNTLILHCYSMQLF